MNSEGSSVSIASPLGVSKEMIPTTSITSFRISSSSQYIFRIHPTDSEEGRGKFKIFSTSTGGAEWGTGAPSEEHDFFTVSAMSTIFHLILTTLHMDLIIPWMVSCHYEIHKYSLFI